MKWYDMVTFRLAGGKWGAMSEAVDDDGKIIIRSTDPREVGTYMVSGKGKTPEEARAQAESLKSHYE